MPDDATLPVVPSQRVIMLKTKNLNKLLSQNTSPHVTSAIIFTPSGSLIASSHATSSPKTLRTQTTLAANIWCAYAATPLPSTTSSAAADKDQHQSQQPTNVTSLTLELSTSNLHITQIRPRLLLCLIGPANINPPPQQQSQPLPCNPPSSSSSTSAGNSFPNCNNNNNNNNNDDTMPPAETHHLDPTAHNNEGPIESSSRGSSMIEADTLAQQSGALGILRMQGEGLARWLEGELEGFSMPETM